MNYPYLLHQSSQYATLEQYLMFKHSIFSRKAPLMIISSSGAQIFILRSLKIQQLTCQLGNNMIMVAI